jgi:NAD(P)H-hydrate epimerase
MAKNGRLVYDTSMKLVTASQMRELDRLAMERGIIGAVLMENAGRAVAREVEAIVAARGRSTVHIVCGTGNNGGDGFVAARHLAIRGIRTVLTVAGDPERTVGDARTNLDLARRMDLPFLPLERFTALENGTVLTSGVLVDAVLGTGATGAPRGAAAQAISAMRRWSGPVVAVDVPSGVDADTGRVPGEAVQANLTVTFGYAKPGLFVYPGASCAGRVIVDPIGCDWSALPCTFAYEWFDESCARAMLPVRPRDAHKGHFGPVLVVGGSSGMPGAPALAGLAALRAGAGLVTLAVPASIQPIAAGHAPEAMCIPLPDRHGVVGAEARPALVKAMERANVICMGPGLSTDEEALDTARWLMGTCPRPLVVDADALTALAGHPEIIHGRKSPTVLTPHPGECARLLGVSSDDIQSDRFAAVRSTALRYGCTVVLKGAGTLVCNAPVAELAEAEPMISIISAGNPGMATGGSGDVLTGVIGALVAQGLDALDAAILGAYVHARAGDAAAAQRGEYGMVAGDIADCIAGVMRDLSEIAG